VHGSTHVDRDEVAQLLEDMAEFNKITGGMRAQKAQHLYHDQKGIVVRAEKMIPQMVEGQGKKKVYRLPDGRTCKLVWELFNHNDPT
jgi:hypothetical protein